MSTFKIQRSSNGSFLGIQRNGQLGFGESGVLFGFIYPMNTTYVYVKAIEINLYLSFYQNNVILKPFSINQSNNFSFMVIINENKLKLMTSNKLWVKIDSNRLVLSDNDKDASSFNIIFTPTENNNIKLLANSIIADNIDDHGVNTDSYIIPNEAIAFTNRGNIKCTYGNVYLTDEYTGCSVPNETVKNNVSKLIFKNLFAERNHTSLDNLNKLGDAYSELMSIQDLHDQYSKKLACLKNAYNIKCIPKIPPKECIRPKDWCYAKGYTYKNSDCTNDGKNFKGDHLCTNLNGETKTILRKNDCKPTQFAKINLQNVCPQPKPIPPKECIRPVDWCKTKDYKYTNSDCTNNGIKGDHICTNPNGTIIKTILRKNDCKQIQLKDKKDLQAVCPQPKPTPPKKECIMPSDWCKLKGSKYIKNDCLNDGIKGDHICTNPDGAIKTILRKNDCKQTPFTTTTLQAVCPQPKPTPPKQCIRPQGWCAHNGSTYSSFDCIGDGKGKDHICTDTSGAIGSILRKDNCNSQWPKADLINNCPAFIPPKIQPPVPLRPAPVPPRPAPVPVPSGTQTFVQLPPGSYSKTCTDCVMDKSGKVLTCKSCQTMAGVWGGSTNILIPSCKNPVTNVLKEIWNDKGKLKC